MVNIRMINRVDKEINMFIDEWIKEFGTDFMIQKNMTKEEVRKFFYKFATKLLKAVYRKQINIEKLQALKDIMVRDAL